MIITFGSINVDFVYEVEEMGNRQASRIARADLNAIASEQPRLRANECLSPALPSRKGGG